jgi:hypothetical protein
MIGRVLIATGLVVAFAAPAQAQGRFEVSFTGGYSTSEGITGDTIITPAGSFNSIDVKSGAAFGLSFGYVLESGGEVGFLWGRQMSKIGVSGTTEIEIGDMNIDHYHGYFAYNFLPDGNVHPYLLIGFGATDYGSVDFTRSTGDPGTVAGPVRFSTTWGAGVKAFASNGKVGFKGGVRWTPTYITSEAEGWWCDPWWGCYLVGDSKYSNQFEFAGGIVFRFGGGD